MMRLAAMGAVIGILMALAAPVRAQEPPADTQSARALGEAGLKLYGEKRYAEAFKRLSMAATLVKAPTIRLYMARCKRELGDLVAARDLYREVTTTELAADASKPFKKAKSDAEQELAQLAERIPSLSVRVTPSEAPAKIVVDGKAFTGSAQLNPGEHVIVVSADRYERAERKVILVEGSTEEVVIELTRDEQPKVADTPPTPEAEAGSLAPALISFGFGAAGLGLGIGFGLAASSELDDIESRCIDGHCLAEDEAAADDARVLAHVSTGGFILGGVGVVLGTVLLIVRPGGGEETALHLSPTGMTLVGTF